METFKEFDQNGTAPGRNFSEILKHAFNTYGKVIGWSVLLLVIMAVISWLLQLITAPLTGYNAMAANQEMQELIKNGDYQAIKDIPGYKESVFISYALGILLYPLTAGFLYIMHKGNTGQPVSFGDLFIGFKRNALQYIIYGVITGIAYFIGLMLCVLPAFLLMPLFFLGSSYILFEDMPAMDALKKSFSVGKENYGTLLGVGFVAAIIAFAGIFLCGIGIIVTLPIIYAAMYSAYCAFVGVPRKIAA